MENKLKNSIDFLNKKTDKDSGFSIPSNYFGSFEDNFELKLIEDNLAKENGFNLPRNYFNKLEDSIISKVPKETKVITLKQKFLKLIPLAAAASVLLFIGLNTFIFNKSDIPTFENLADFEVENWITENINSITDNDLSIAYTDVEFDDTDFVPNSISDVELENYLNNQDNLSLILENE